MNKLIFPALIATIILSSAFKIAGTVSNWKLKEESYNVSFTSKKVQGIFKGLKTEIIFDENNLSISKIKASIDATTVNTGNGMRNKHARQGLGADQFTVIHFESTSIIKTPAGYEAHGKLNIKDISKDIKLPFTFTKNNEGGIFSGSFSVIPKEYHIEKMGTPELIEVQLNVPVIK